MPLLSSLIVIGVYGLRADAVFGATSDTTALQTWVGERPRVSPHYPVAARTGGGLRLRPTLPAGAGRRAIRLAAAGMAVLLAQQAATLMVMVISNRVGGAGVFVVFSYVQAVYLLPYAVLAVPVATIAFPRLSELASDPQATKDTDRMIARTSRLVVVLGLLGAACRRRQPLGHAGGPTRLSEAADLPALRRHRPSSRGRCPAGASSKTAFHALERSRIAASPRRSAGPPSRQRRREHPLVTAAPTRGPSSSWGPPTSWA